MTISKPPLIEKLSADTAGLLGLRRQFGMVKQLNPQTGTGRTVGNILPDVPALGARVQKLNDSGVKAKGYYSPSTATATQIGNGPADARRATVRHESVHAMIDRARGSGDLSQLPLGMRLIAHAQNFKPTKGYGDVLEEATAQSVGSKFSTKGRTSMPGFIWGNTGAKYMEHYKNNGQDARYRALRNMRYGGYGAAGTAGLGAVYGATQLLPGSEEVKQAELLPNVQLQPHQEAIVDEAKEQPLRKLLMHSLGSGKTLSAIAASEARGDPYTAIVPAALRPNFQKEQQKFTDQQLPSQVMSYTALGSGKNIEHPNTLVFDEAHRLRNPSTAMSQAARKAADRAKQVLLLSGTPVVNDPSDLAVPTSILTQQQISPAKFRERFVRERQVEPGFFAKMRGVQPGKEEDITNAEELKAMLRGHVDYYAPPKSAIPVNYEDHHVEMGPEQSQIYKGMWEQLPYHIRWKLKNDFPMNSKELQRSVSFLTGPRQVSLSTMPYLREKDPLKAFGHSPKLQKAHELLQQQLVDERKKALVFSNFIDAGLSPYAAKLKESGIPHGVFHGGLSDKQRKQLVDDYNANKIRVALLGPSGTEGLSFKGTNLIQQLDPYWNQTRNDQSAGRGLRFDSHTDLPSDLQNATVQRFHSKLPLGFKDRMLSSVGFNKEDQQRAADSYLTSMSARKQKLNDKFTALLREIGTRQPEPGEGV